MKVDELRWKRMAVTLLEFKNGDEALARKMGIAFLEILPTKNALFPDTIEAVELSDRKENTIFTSLPMDLKKRSIIN